MAPGGSGGTQEDYIDETSAKHLLDSIGKKVHDEVKNGEAKTFKGELEGKLSQASILGESAGTDDPCNLESEYTKLINGSGGGVAARGHPCGNESVSEKRFSKERVAEYDEKKIGCSNSEGACAPFRRLHLCNKNFQKINNYSSNAKHNLLLDVCLAANHEGQSIKTHLKRYDAEYPSGSGHTTCTALARSFADIGDIIRGRDLYRRDSRTDKLEENLKVIFGNIYKELTSTSDKNGELQTRYNDESGNYYQLREDWWNANRHTVWKAITCSEDLNNSSYFHATCIDGQSGAQANKYCRCNDNQVPTYFDYVPQFLRWFEEWAEDFCRKKKKYVNIVKTYCRGKDKSGNERYCSRNGFDCEKTISRIGKVRMGKGCTDCFFACYPYENWIDNKKKEFLKQKEKYPIEIRKYTNEASLSRMRQKRAARGGSDHKGYEKIFYDKLQETEYKDVGEFLEKLNDEDICRKIDDEEGGIIHFEKVNSSSTNDTSGTNDKTKGTFYRSKYCQPCPDCGVRHKGKGEFEDKETTGKKCAGQILYKPKNPEEGTPINFLYSGDEEKEIAKNLKAFCDQTNGDTTNNGSNELYEEWKCYEFKHLDKVGEGEDDEDDVNEVRNAGGLCILKKEKKEVEETNSQKEPDEIQKTFHNFFYYWVAHMLKDSIHWRTKKIKSCINNTNESKACKNNNKCNRECDCFEKWVGQKKEKEWKPIKEHFGKQEGLDKEDNSSQLGFYLRMTADVVLQEVLKLEFSKENTEEDAENNVSAREIDLINKMLKEDEKEQEEDDGADNKNKNTIDKLLKHEEKEAEKCKKIQKDCENQKKQQPTGGRARSEEPPDSPPRADPKKGDSEGEDEEEEEEEEEEEGEDGAETTTEETVETTKEEGSGSPAPTTKEEGKAACEIVKTLFNDTSNFSDACGLKYGKNAPTSWKCIPSGNTSEPTGKSDGSICIPPRRRRLYVGGLTKWASDTVGNTGESQTQPQGQTPSQSEKLRTAFIESAAIETFFLWHKYKNDKQREKKEKEEAQGNVYKQTDDNDEAQKELQQTGEIPNDFLRQMFYTLGDYRDILFGKNDIVIGNTGSGASDKEMKAKEEKIKETIDKVFPNSVSTPPTPVTENSDEQRKSWWKQYAESIWNGMICALTYNTDSGDKGQTPTQDTQVKDKLWDENSKKPKETKYQYNSVKLDDTSGAKGPQSSASSENTPTHLSKFVLRPPYFRYLEEWGETFCRKQKHKLEIIRVDCRGKDGDKNCSGDGFDCDDESPNKDEIFEDFLCPTCARHCRSYRKWIERKKDEFIKQKEEYRKQKEQCKKESNNHDNEFCTKLETCSKAGDFLERLKNGPCTKNNNGGNNINFNNTDDTFKPATNCKPCSQFKVKCINGVCNGDGTKVTCPGGKISADDIPSLGNSTKILDMRVSDKDANGFEGGLNDSCKDAHIFKGFRKEEWKCRNVCGVDICTLEKTNNGQGKEHIIVKELLKRWLEYFFEDYNRIQKKLKTCRNNKGFKCIKACVDEWIKLKKEEWKKIKDTYLDKYTKENPEGNNLKTFLEDLIPRMDLVNDKGKITKLSKFDKSCGCSTSASSEKSKEDPIECLLNKLTEKIKTATCPNQTSSETLDQSDGTLQTPCQKSPAPVEDDEEQSLEETEENTVGNKAPAFCEIEEKKEDEEEKCEEATATPKKPAPPAPSGDSNTEQTPILKPEEEAPEPEDR
ncbi:hypothetical protein PFFCH_04688 [Plasmodium falciparum FCH/4]|uniref:Erythrocyte membrane protein 1 n=1 Tax=Plasmodium falciparum FCH/4 TaxID=1036724 RepID=A0A024VHE5_PLAFA|nr:hypothetical protein PFFCH_04688 [Plasmodium falciparum FCH/4]